MLGRALARAARTRAQEPREHRHAARDRRCPRGTSGVRTAATVKPLDDFVRNASRRTAARVVLQAVPQRARQGVQGQGRRLADLPPEAAVRHHGGRGRRHARASRAALRDLQGRAGRTRRPRPRDRCGARRCSASTATAVSASSRTTRWLLHAAAYYVEFHTIRQQIQAELDAAAQRAGRAPSGRASPPVGSDRRPGGARDDLRASDRDGAAGHAGATQAGEADE